MAKNSAERAGLARFASMLARFLLPLGLLSFVACAASDDGSPPPAAKSAPVAKKKAKKTHKDKVRPPEREEVRAESESPREKPSEEPAAPKVEKPECPEEMVLVQGDYCRAVEQRCLEQLSTPDAGADENRCARFEASKCTSTAPEPRKMSYCMDRYEYPGKVGELPMTLVSWTDAERVCQAEGKRLCTESEFTFACEGEKMLPYTYGYERDPKKCNIDKPYQTPQKHLLPYDQCLANPSCAAEYKRVDGREPIGSHPECVSPFGIYDLNGNANEWVSQPWKNPPHRSGIKGGWWGPVRNRCRAITLSHGETYLGYEVGFRCCKDATGAVDGGAPDAQP